MNTLVNVWPTGCQAVFTLTSPPQKRIACEHCPVGAKWWNQATLFHRTVWAAMTNKSHVLLIQPRQFYIENYLKMGIFGVVTYMHINDKGDMEV